MKMNESIIKNRGLRGSLCPSLLGRFYQGGYFHIAELLPPDTVALFIGACFANGIRYFLSIPDVV